jgi:hypothetical protein
MHRGDNSRIWGTRSRSTNGHAPCNQHLIHDAGAFQIGIGAALLLALVCPDALLVALTGFTLTGWRDGPGCPRW